MLKKTTKVKPPSFANQLLLKRLEIAAFNEIANLVGNNPQGVLDKLVFDRELIHGPIDSKKIPYKDPKHLKKSAYSDAFTNGVLNDEFSIDDGEMDRSKRDVKKFNFHLADPASKADLAIGTSIAFATGQTALFSEESMKFVHDQKKGEVFQREVASQIRPNVSKTIGEFTVDHTQSNGLSIDTSKRVRSAAGVYKLLDELIKLYEDQTLTNSRSKNATMQKLLTEAFVIAENDKLSNESKVAIILDKSRNVLNDQNKNVGKFNMSGFFHLKSSKQNNNSWTFATTLQSIIHSNDPHQKTLSRINTEMNHLLSEKNTDLADEKMRELHKQFVNYVSSNHLDHKPEYKQSITIFNNLYRKMHEKISAAEDDVIILPKPKEDENKTQPHAKDDDVIFIHPKDTKYPIIEKNKKMIVHELQKLRDADLLSPKTKTTISAMIKCLKSDPLNEKQFEAIIQGACKRRNIMQKKGLITKDVGKQFTKVLNALNELHNDEMSPKKFDSILRHEFKHLKETRLDAQDLTSRSRLRY